MQIDNEQRRALLPDRTQTFWVQMDDVAILRDYAGQTPGDIERLLVLQENTGKSLLELFCEARGITRISDAFVN